MAEMVIYLAIGLAAGLVIGGLVIYLLPYQSLKGEQARTVVELIEVQAQNNKLHSTLQEEQAKGYQGRQTMMLRQKRLESDLVEAGERLAAMEQQSAALQEQSEQRRQAQQQEKAQLAELVDRLEQDKAALQESLEQKALEWREERQSLTLLITQLDDQVKTLRKDKSDLSSRLEHQHEAWEQERLSLQIQMNALEDSLSLQKMQDGSGLSPDTERMIEQLQTELEDLRKQRGAWEEERQMFQEQLKRLQAERRSLRNLMATSSAEGGEGTGEAQELRRQLEQAQQKYQALEAENEHLMERLAREAQSGSVESGAQNG